MTRKPSRVFVLALLVWHFVAGFAAPLAHATMATHGQGGVAATSTAAVTPAAATADHCASHSHSGGKHNCCADDSCQCAAPTFAAAAATLTISFAKAHAISAVVRVALVPTRANLFFRPPIA